MTTMEMLLHFRISHATSGDLRLTNDHTCHRDTANKATEAFRKIVRKSCQDCTGGSGQENSWLHRLDQHQRKSWQPATTAALSLDSSGLYPIKALTDCLHLESRSLWLPQLRNLLLLPRTASHTPELSSHDFVVVSVMVATPMNGATRPDIFCHQCETE
jgi:hypothetical protein